MLKRYTLKLGVIVIVLATAGCELTNQSTYELYQSYRLQSDNKAYAIGSNKVAGAAWGASDTEEAMKLANETCIKLGGINCRVIEINGSSVTN